MALVVELRKILQGAEDSQWGSTFSPDTHWEGFLRTQAQGSANTLISPSSEGLLGVLHSCFSSSAFFLGDEHIWMLCVSLLSRRPEPNLILKGVCQMQQPWLVLVNKHHTKCHVANRWSLTDLKGFPKNNPTSLTDTWNICNRIKAIYSIVPIYQLQK